MKGTSLFSDRIFFSSLFTIAIPIMLQNLASSFVNMIGTVMIGRLGTTEIAAVGLGTQVFFLLNMILFGVCSGASVFTAQYWGKGEIAGIRKTTGLCLALALTVAGAFTVVCALAPRTIIGLYSSDEAVIAIGARYLRITAGGFIPFACSFVFELIMRSTERVKLALAATFISLGINIALSWLLIFGIGPFPRLGVEGAAVATVVARIVEMAIVVTASYARRYALAGKLSELFAIDVTFLSRFAVIALPVMVNETLWALGITTQNVIFARTETDAIAAFNIVTTISSMVWFFFIGLGNGAAVVIGKKIGEGDERTARDYASRITRFGPLMAVFCALFLIPTSWLLPFVFKADARVFAFAGSMLVVLAFAYPARAFNMAMVVGVCRAGGDTVFCVFYDLFFMWMVALPAAAVATFFFHAPVWVVYICVLSEEPLKMLIGIWRLKSGRWLNTVT